MRALIKILTILLVSLGAVFLFRGSFHLGAKPLPILGSLEPFYLRDQAAQRVTSDHFSGKVTVVDFIFTRCPGICPLLTQRMAELERRTRDLGSQIQFISISVDPENDIPLVLKAYTEKQNLNLMRWKFLTGPLDSIEKVVVEGFRTQMGKRHIATESGPDLLEITHGENFILVDPRLNLRLFHKVQTDDDLQVVYKSALRLIKESF